MIRRANLSAVLLAALALSALAAPATAPGAETGPWWGIEAGARPTNLWKPADELQELTAATSGATVVRIEGATVGCFAPTSTSCLTTPPYKGPMSAADLQGALEEPAAYGPGGVTVGESSPGVFRLAAAGPMAARWIPPLEASGTGAGAKILTEGGSGRIVLTVTDVGDAPAQGASEAIEVRDVLPEGAIAYGAKAYAGYQDLDGPAPCTVEAGGGEVSCTLAGTLPAFEAIEVEVFASLTDTAAAAAHTGTVSVSGGGAPPRSVPQALHVSPEAVRFGIQSFAMGAEGEAGAPVAQAGSHPFQLTTSLQLNVGPVLHGGSVRYLVDQPDPPRNFRFPLPLGLVGDPSQIPTCSFAQFTTQEEFVNECPASSAIGVASVTVIEAGVLKFARIAVPIFNLVPAYGEPARFGFMAAGVPVTIDTSLDAEDEYRITALSSNAPELATLLSTTATIWGNPGDPAHDAQRGWGCVYFSHPGPCTRPPEESEAAFLRMPVNCSEPVDFDMELEPWNTPLGTAIERASSPGGLLLGCSRVPFDPSLAAAPTSRSAESPTGLDFQMNLPNAGLHNPEGIAEAEPRKMRVALPEGITANPSAAEGLGVCSEAQYRAEKLGSGPGEGCPEASKLGTLTAHTPLVEGAIEGSLYLARPYANPFGSLLALYLVARLPERGALVKQAGAIEPDPRTGQLISTFDRLPQLPYSDVRLHFREGARAPLITPPACDTYRTEARFLPYSAHNLDNPSPGELVGRTSAFAIDRGVDGGPCPQGAAPFDPGFQAGSINNAAGRYSPFYMRLTRKDGDQDLTRFSAKLPPGVVGRLAGTEQCSDAQIARARSRTGPHGGEEERNDPSCPAGSQIGRIVAGAGVGSVLTYVPGKLYLAGPLNGAPLSVVAIVPGLAGPFDVGTVVTREALRINPLTAEVEADGSASDPIPHILKGLPLKVRDIRVYVDKPDFTLNPTSCEESATEATIWSGGQNVFSGLDDIAHSLSSRFQAAGCASLAFKPHLKLTLRGASPRRGGHPALHGVFAPRKGDANLRRLVLRLPRSAFLDQGHIRTICTRVQFAADGGNGAGCPKAAVYGHAKAFTPLLSQPLEGPVYLRSSNHNLPDFVAALHGLIDVEAVARIDSRHGGIRTTFATVPDAPLSRVVVNMQGGKKGLIVNSRNLCHKPGKNRANASFLAHNGRRAAERPLLRVAKCRKAKRKRHTRHSRR